MNAYYQRMFAPLELVIVFILVAIILMAVLAMGIQLYKYLKTYDSNNKMPVPFQAARAAEEFAEDDGELVAVITAAITSATGSSDFTIKSIVPNDPPQAVSNWVLSGRLEAFQSRRVIKR